MEPGGIEAPFPFTFERASHGNGPRREHRAGRRKPASLGRCHLGVFEGFWAGDAAALPEWLTITRTTRPSGRTTSVWPVPAPPCGASALTDTLVSPFSRTASPSTAAVAPLSSCTSLVK